MRIPSCRLGGKTRITGYRIWSNNQGEARAVFLEVEETSWTTEGFLGGRRIARAKPGLPLRMETKNLCQGEAFMEVKQQF